MVCRRAINQTSASQKAPTEKSSTNIEARCPNCGRSYTLDQKTLTQYGDRDYVVISHTADEICVVGISHGDQWRDLPALSVAKAPQEIFGDSPLTDGLRLSAVLLDPTAPQDGITDLNLERLKRNLT